MFGWIRKLLLSIFFVESEGEAIIYEEGGKRTLSEKWTDYEFDADGSCKVSTSIKPIVELKDPQAYLYLPVWFGNKHGRFEERDT
ncbi:MAG: hypothetical protein IID32_00265 [Planctomycetes bacterium]|nr:hypothetical protein [Planctomycetota bacterium]